MMMNGRMCLAMASKSDRKPMPEDPKELARAMFRDADRKLATKLAESEQASQPVPDTSTASQPSP